MVYTLDKDFKTLPLKMPKGLEKVQEKIGEQNAKIDGKKMQRESRKQYWY